MKNYFSRPNLQAVQGWGISIRKVCSIIFTFRFRKSNFNSCLRMGSSWASVAEWEGGVGQACYRILVSLPLHRHSLSPQTDCSHALNCTTHSIFTLTWTNQNCTPAHVSALQQPAARTILLQHEVSKCSLLPVYLHSKTEHSKLHCG